MTCQYASSGCNYPEGECLGVCMKAEPDADRELLELAAKAASYPIHSDAWARRYADGGETLFMGNSGPVWNPLTEDGDALRLAVKLKLNVNGWGAGASATAFVGKDIAVAEPHYGDDPARATRRAIVRAAAEIGKVMK